MKVPEWYTAVASDPKLIELGQQYQEACQQDDDFAKWAIQVRRRERLAELGIAWSNPAQLPWYQ